MFDKSAEFYDAIYSWKNYKDESAKLHEWIQRFKLSDGNSLLDVACGTGAHLAFLRDHYAVEGVDLDARMLKIASYKLPEASFHHGDMQTFDLGRQYDVVLCLFSSIGYVRTVDAMRTTIANLARHCRPGGLVIVEPWFAPGEMDDQRAHGLYHDTASLKIARMNHTTLTDDLSILHFHYLVATPGHVEHFTEDHTMGLFTREQYTQAFSNAGLDVTYDERGLMDRGLYIGVNPPVG
jgi:ubiquinone/menaquinone biosynthesis C-methylase UbiE